MDKLKDYPTPELVGNNAAAGPAGPYSDVNRARGSQTLNVLNTPDTIAMPDILPAEALAWAPPDFTTVQLIEPTASQLSPRVRPVSVYP